MTAIDDAKAKLEEAVMTMAWPGLNRADYDSSQARVYVKGVRDAVTALIDAKLAAWGERERDMPACTVCGHWHEGICASVNELRARDGIPPHEQTEALRRAARALLKATEGDPNLCPEWDRLSDLVGS